MSKEHKSHWPEAPRINLVAVPRPDMANSSLKNPEGEFFSGRSADVAQKKLTKWRDLLRAASFVNTDDIKNVKAETKPELVRKVYSLFSDHATSHTPYQGSLSYAATAGAGVIAAYLDMIARLQVRVNDQEFNDEQYRSAASDSLRTILDMAALSNDADAALTASITARPREDIRHLLKTNSTEKLYEDLQLDDSYFDVNDIGAVKLKDLDEIQDRVTTLNGNQYSFSSKKDDVMLGCPFRSKIASLYDAMTEAMLQNGIALHSFQETQAAHRHIGHSLGKQALVGSIEKEN